MTTAGAAAGDPAGTAAGDPPGTGESYRGGMPDRGNSTGGGIAHTSGGGAGSPTASAAKYPPPPDIPSGDDDDVVARQLREAATREPDPAVRAKLWQEYRKYKGIEK